jgi:hypothetical protein
MVDGAIPIMDGVIHLMDGVIHLMDGVILITDMDHTGQAIIADTGMVIIMAADTIIQHLITPTRREDEATAMVFVSLGQVIRNMVPGA